MNPARVAMILLAGGLQLASTSPAEAHEGWGVVVDAAGHVYVADIPANTIWRISPDGRMEPVGRHIHSHAPSLGLDGALYGTHTNLTEPIRGVWRRDVLVHTSGSGSSASMVAR